MWSDVMRCGGGGGGGESPQLGSFSRPFSEPGLLHGSSGLQDWSYTNIMTPHCGNANEFLDGSPAARWERRIHQIVILRGRFRVKRLPGTPLQSWDVQFHIAQFLATGKAGFRSCVSGAQGCYCCTWPYLHQHRHQRQEELRKTHRLQWSGAVFRGGLPPVGRRFQW